MVTTWSFAFAIELLKPCYWSILLARQTFFEIIELVEIAVLNDKITGFTRAGFNLRMKTKGF